ncbi:MAG: 16S rRNA (cytosine(1402)-N(4))-methyltransferase RsmH [Nitrospirae bacterium]|nr:16S rRNA (cytosine(1402)-N(4))-methyltransferase RsmH [Nitrospirota bacterium]
MPIVHLPVLAREVNELLALQKGGIYVDATVGLGGHSEMMLNMIGQDGRVIGLDRDEAALKKTAERLNDNRVTLKKTTFSSMEESMHSLGIHSVDGILFDLGVSMMQLRDAARGFSFLSEERLDMRMDSALSFSAWDVVNTYSEEELVRILREYGEEFRAARIVRAVMRSREEKTIDTCAELAGIVSRAVGRSGRTHPATRVFQAIRIEVNRELDELRTGLDASLRMLKQGGRLCVISYHSLEDRIVKNFMRDNAKAGHVRQLTKKPIVASREEMRVNPSSRSAKLRGAEKA